MNIYKETETYIKNHPSINDSIKNKLINYSSLSRKIINDLKLKEKDFDAVLIACRRYYNKIKLKQKREDNIIDLLRNSKLEIKNKIMVVVMDKIFSEKLFELEKKIQKKKNLIHIIEGVSTKTIITTEDYFYLIKNKFKKHILKINKGLVEIIIESSQHLENLSGVTGYLYSLFGENGINILETLSCWTDTIFIIKEEDVSKAIELLRFT